MRGRGARHYKTITVEKEKTMTTRTIASVDGFSVFEVEGDYSRAFVRVDGFDPVEIPHIFVDGEDTLEVCADGRYGYVWWCEEHPTAGLVQLEELWRTEYVEAVDGAAQLDQLNRLVEERGAGRVFGDSGGLFEVEGSELADLAGAGQCRGFLVVDEVADRPDLYAAEFLTNYRGFEVDGVNRVVVVVVDLKNGLAAWRESEPLWGYVSEEQACDVADRLSARIIQNM